MGCCKDLREGSTEISRLIVGAERGAVGGAGTLCPTLPARPVASTQVVLPPLPACVADDNGSEVNDCDRPSGGKPTEEETEQALALLLLLSKDCREAGSERGGCNANGNAVC